MKPPRKKRKWKGRLLLFSLMCGILYFAEQRYSFFRLRSIEIVSGGILPDAIVWQAVPRDGETFWPALILPGNAFTKRIERFYPVDVDLKIAGWGRYRVTIKPLSVFLMVSWNSRMWLLSTNGRMWLANLPANVKVKGIEHPDRPILAWDAGLPLPIDPERQGGDIYPSSLPLAKIKGWYDTLSQTSWYDDTYCLFAKRVDGKPVIQILLGSEEEITGEIVVKEDTSHWLSLSAAVQEIFPAGDYKKPPGLIINATFSDLKFTVTNKEPKRALN